MASAAMPKRFYTEAVTQAGPDGFYLALDGRVARTPGRKPLQFPTEAAADLVTVEWNRQGKHVDLASMPVTRLANAAIDCVADDAQAVIDDLVRYSGSDLICYRAADPPALALRQTQIWDPVLDQTRLALGCRFVLSEGIVHVAQPDRAVAAIRATVDRLQHPFGLAAAHVMTTMTGSVLIVLAFARGELDIEAAWHAAHVDEDFQIERWGRDEEAELRRAARLVDFTAAARLLLATIEQGP